MGNLIEHNRHERRLTNTIYWIALGLVAFNWAVYLYINTPDWWSICLGAFSMGVLATWAIEISGNRFPGSRSSH